MVKKDQLLEDKNDIDTKIRKALNESNEIDAKIV
jgi:hypothetical protein